MLPGANKEAHNSFCPLFQLDVGLELMDNWAHRFAETQVAYRNSSNNDNGSEFASGQDFGLLEDDFRNDSLGDIFSIIFFQI